MTEHETPKHPLRKMLDAIDLPVQPGHRSERAENHTRMDRAISWLECHDACPEDKPDERFLFLWIAFNAAYGADDHLKLRNESKPNDHKKFDDFLHIVVKHDKGSRLADFIRAHTKSLREIMETRFLFIDFWRGEYSNADRSTWKKYFEETQDSMKRALRDVSSGRGKNFDFVTVLGFAFDRLYTLRNQLIHGNASWRDKYNRSSLKVGNAVLGSCIPVILEIMLAATAKNPDMLWGGRVAYPPYLPKPDDDTNQKPPRRDKLL